MSAQTLWVIELCDSDTEVLKHKTTSSSLGPLDEVVEPSSTANPLSPHVLHILPRTAFLLYLYDMTVVHYPPRNRLIPRTITPGINT